MKKVKIIITCILFIIGAIFFSCKKEGGDNKNVNKSIIPELKDYILKNNKSENFKKLGINYLLNNNNSYNYLGIAINESILYTNLNCKSDNSDYISMYTNKINSYNISSPNFENMTFNENEILIYHATLLSIPSYENVDSILFYIQRFVYQTYIIENFIYETESLDNSQKERLFFLLTSIKNVIGTPVGPGITIEKLEMKLPTAAEIRQYEWLVQDCSRKKLKEFWDEPLSGTKIKKIATFPLFFMTEIHIPCSYIAGQQMGWW